MGLLGGVPFQMAGQIGLPFGRTEASGSTPNGDAAGADAGKTRHGDHEGETQEPPQGKPPQVCTAKRITTARSGDRVTFQWIGLAQNKR